MSVIAKSRLQLGLNFQVVGVQCHATFQARQSLVSGSCMSEARSFVIEDPVNRSLSRRTVSERSLLSFLS